MKKIKAKLDGEPWTGSKEDDVDDEFRDIDESDYHSIKPPDGQIVNGPQDADENHDILDKTLRDMTGALRSLKHTLLHNSQFPCPEKSVDIAYKQEQRP